MPDTQVSSESGAAPLGGIEPGAGYETELDSMDGAIIVDLEMKAQPPIDMYMP
ncbi:hypothetical protein KGP36_01960 [Patescibacteria group bacterium]|nr:hypothetical protein [Patescibacteria group bacterium]